MREAAFTPTGLASLERGQAAVATESDDKQAK
jgi:hypothetical protein